MPRARQKVVAPPPVVEVPLPEEPEAVKGGLFEDLDDDDVVMTVAPSEAELAAPLPPLDEGLTPDEKKEFISLINKELPLAVRAKQLGILARKTGQKTAAVGLRAIIEANEITGLRKDRATEATPMFALPPGTTVDIKIQKVVK